MCAIRLQAAGSEPPSGLAGGKVVGVDRVEWLAIPDHQTAVNALMAGEIDYIERRTTSLLRTDKNIRIITGLQHDRRAVRFLGIRG